MCLPGITLYEYSHEWVQATYTGSTTYTLHAHVTRREGGKGIG